MIFTAVLFLHMCVLLTVVKEVLLHSLHSLLHCPSTSFTTGAKLFYFNFSSIGDRRVCKYNVMFIFFTLLSYASGSVDFGKVW